MSLSGMLDRNFEGSHGNRKQDRGTVFMTAKSVTRRACVTRDCHWSVSR